MRQYTDTTCTDLLLRMSMVYTQFSSQTKCMMLLNLSTQNIFLELTYMCVFMLIGYTVLATGALLNCHEILHHS